MYFSAEERGGLTVRETAFLHASEWTLKREFAVKACMERNNFDTPFFSPPSVFHLYCIIFFRFIVGNGLREGEEKKREGRRKGLYFNVKMIGLSCLLIQKNTEFLNFQSVLPVKLKS